MVLGTHDWGTKPKPAMTPRPQQPPGHLDTHQDHCEARGREEESGRGRHHIREGEDIKLGCTGVQLRVKVHVRRNLGPKEVPDMGLGKG